MLFPPSSGIYHGCNQSYLYSTLGGHRHCTVHGALTHLPPLSEKVMNHCYTPFKDGTLSSNLWKITPCQYSTSNAESSEVLREGLDWTDQLVARLRHVSAQLQWNQCVSVGFIRKLAADYTPPSKHCLSRSCRWINLPLKCHTTPYSLRLTPGNTDVYKAAPYISLQRAVKEAKHH